ncbi:protein SPEAR3-like [Solanum lycopersicum]|uniref:Protein SPEAR3-like n=1 Tax=Solanum lycopersicum TaxID=4081 RepID=A0A3Q7H6E1_SOLLC|nr:protein SPEAR3-like [Solanum lycopersicum]
MGSGYFGEPKLGNERSSSSSRKSKKNNNLEKPKQPQRGLGVAQLEKIRLHTQMGCNTYNPYSSTPSFSSYSSSTSSYAFTPQQTIMMGLGDIERANIRYGDSQLPSTPSAWHPGTVYEPHQFAQPNMNRYLLNLQIEESMENRTRNNSIGSSTSHISESNGDHELDLELRLSI